jgi:hypothetical protein
MVFSSNLIRRLLVIGAFAWVPILWGNEAFANMSLPFDIDLTANEADEEVAEPSIEEANSASSPDPAPVVPLEPPPPLRPTTNVSEDLSPGYQPAPVEDNLPSLPEPSDSMPPAEAMPAEVSPQNLENFLLGQDTDTAVAMLEQDGWVVVAQTPGLVQLDRGQLGLDLEVDNTTGRVVGVDLLNSI